MGIIKLIERLPFRERVAALSDSQIRREANTRRLDRKRLAHAFDRALRHVGDVEQITIEAYRSRPGGHIP
jgi:hypothetical protein